MLLDVLIHVLKIVIMYHSLSLINASSIVLDDTYRISVYIIVDVSDTCIRYESHVIMF